MPRKSPRRRIINIFIVIGLIAAIGISMRMYGAYALRDEASQNTAPIVAVVKAAAGAGTEEVVFPGTVQAWHDSPIYARTNGYLKEWKTDIGAQVKAGDVLAEIDAPEVDAQLRQTEAELRSAQANNRLAQNTAGRWKEMLKTQSVSIQAADERISDATAKTAALASAQANLDRLKELESFKRVVAPFDGVITARNTDKGALINAGSGNGAGQELFHIADATRLRIYVQVPQAYSGAIKPGLTADLVFAEHPGKKYTATLLQTANALDPVSRSLLTQFEVDNKDGELLAGGYTEVHIKLPSDTNHVRLPVNTLIFRADGLQVATVDNENKAQLKTITMGRDYGNEVEILSGVEPSEAIIVNPPDSLYSGQIVRVQQPAEKKEEKNKL